MSLALSPLATRSRLVARGLADGDVAVRLAAVAVAVDDGLERHARVLADHVTSQPTDIEVLGAVRDAVLDHPWAQDDDDPWAGLLRRWAGSTTVVEEVPAPPRTRRSPWGMLQTLLELFVLALVPLEMGAATQAFAGTPRGYDAWGHVSKIALLVRAFPHIAWNPYWYAGLPHFTQSYPPLFHLTGAFLVGVFGLSAERAVTVLAIVSIVVAAWAVYASVRLLIHRRLPALAAATLFMASPSVWAHVVQMGTYVRLFALMFLSLSVLAALAYARRPSRLRLAGAVAALAATLLSHLLVALVACGAVGIILLVAPSSTLRSRVVRAASIGLPAAALAAWFYVPFVLLPRPKTTAAAVMTPASWRSLVVSPSKLDIEALPVALLPLIGVALVLIVPVVVRSWRSTTSPRSIALRHWLRRPAWARVEGPSVDSARVALATTVPDVTRVASEAHRTLTGVLTLAGGCAIAGLGAVGFALAGHFGLGIYLYGIAPQNLYIYASWLLAVAGAVTVSVATPGRRRFLGDALLLVAALASVAVTIAHLPPAPPPDAGRAALMAAFPKPADHQHQYRVAQLTDPGGDWLGARHDTEQLRGYQNQGTVNVDWQFWAEQAVWNTTLAALERHAILDWYGVGWLYADKQQADASDPFEAAPDDYQRVAIAKDPNKTHVYRVLGTSPIVTTVTQRTALVIGSDENYALVFRALASAGFASDELVPVHGGLWIDAFSGADLRRFDTVVLYGANAHSWKNASRVLDTYVRAGGRIFMDAGDDKPMSKAKLSVSPVRKTAEWNVIGTWGMKTSADPVLDGVNVAGFAPPRYNSAPYWLVKNAVSKAPWAHTVIEAGGSNVVVSGHLGRGTVVWSGINLPFHIAGSTSAEERQFLRNLVAPGDTASALPGTRGQYVNAEHRRITVGAGTRGVLVKETYSADWRATLSGTRRPVYRAGPDFMYIPTDGRAGTVDLTYQQGMAELLGWAVTLAAAVGLVVYALSGRRRPWAKRAAAAA